MPAQRKNNQIQQLKLKDFGTDLLMEYQHPVTPHVPSRSSIVVQSRSEHPCKDHISASRRDYYKITLITEGSGIFTLGGRRYEVNGPVLIFINPVEVKTWESKSAEQDGYYCLFTESLFETQRHYRDEIIRHPLFQLGADAVLPLNEEQVRYLQSLFLQLRREYNNVAAFRQEAIMLYLQLLLLEAKRIGAQVSEEPKTLTASQLLAQRFTDLLEKQFPIETVQQQVQFRSAREFAQLLNVHPNHLNATIKQVTGRTVSEHIRHRILLESRLLLRHTNWQIAEIAWCVGFEEPGNFTHFFKSQTGQSPHLFRSL